MEERASAGRPERMQEQVPLQDSVATHVHMEAANNMMFMGAAAVVQACITAGYLKACLWLFFDMRRLLAASHSSPHFSQTADAS